MSIRLRFVGGIWHNRIETLEELNPIDVPVGSEIMTYEPMRIRSAAGAEYFEMHCEYATPAQISPETHFPWQGKTFYG